MAYLLLVLTTLFWSGNAVLARAMHMDIPPIGLAFWRWTLAASLLLPFVLPHLRRQWSLLLQHWRLMLCLSILGVANFNTFLYIGLQTTTATNGTLLQSAVPIVIMLLAWGLFGERIRGGQLLGILLSMLGVLVIVSQGALATLLQLSLNRGDLWVLGAVLTWALYSVLLRLRPAGLDHYAFLGVTLVVGALCLLPFWLWEWRVQGRSMLLDTQTGLTLGYMAIFPSILAYLFWNHGVAVLGAPKAGMFVHLMPVFGLLLAVTFLGERVQGFHLAGIVLIFLGIYLAMFRNRATTGQTPQRKA